MSPSLITININQGSISTVFSDRVFGKLVDTIGDIILPHRNCQDSEERALKSFGYAYLVIFGSILGMSTNHCCMGNDISLKQYLMAIAAIPAITLFAYDSRNCSPFLFGLFTVKCCSKFHLL